MEQALARDEQRDRKGRRLREAFDDYQLQLGAGDRELALASLRLCVELAESKGDYRRLLEELEQKRIASGVVRIYVSHGEVQGEGRLPLALVGLPLVRLGREPTAELCLRGSGLSRWHAEVAHGEAGWALRDAGSRNGTRIAGARIEAEVPLEGDGSFELGDDSEVAWHVDGGVLRLEVQRGLDRGRCLLAAVGTPIVLPGGGARVSFREGRPYLEVIAAPPPPGVVAAAPALPGGASSSWGVVRLNGARTGAVVQLIQGDVVESAGARYEVA